MCERRSVTMSAHLETRSQLGFSRVKSSQIDGELTIRIVGTDEIQTLNASYREQNKATNVLAFPFEPPVELELKELGDVVICAEVVAKEANEQK